MEGDQQRPTTLNRRDRPPLIHALILTPGTDISPSHHDDYLTRLPPAQPQARPSTPAIWVVNPRGCGLSPLSQG
ncbi:hypothetical protein GCM10022235_65480 [Kribbella ginsengisoli]|uniref:Alpha/beta hydrolase n=1 Tax=Kribbella ginsengisoli TaxID=363865 RepID=A0ABP6YR99_9ACTN